MIKFRKNPFSDISSEYEIKEGEVVSDLVLRVLESEEYKEADKVSKAFQVYINGHKLDHDLWVYVKTKPSDEVLIGPRLERGDGAQLFKTVAMLAVAVAVMTYNPYAGGTLAAAAFAVGVTATAGLLLNGLIPPPGLPGLGGSGNSSEDSQMYSIASQSNATKKFGYVPKVYGTHRMFPNVVATPYTEVTYENPEVGNNKLVQYFYAIYDFGFGPAHITNVKIGDTHIENYDDASFRLVDPNKPAGATGAWEDALNTSFAFYKNDVERDGTTVSLDKNQTDAGAFQDEYQVIRLGSDKVFGDEQEILIDFVAPEGLIAYGTDGSEAKRRIVLDIQFAKVGTNDWHPFNDLRYAKNPSSLGGYGVQVFDPYVDIEPFDPTSIGDYDDLRHDKGTFGRHYYGYRKGKTFITIKTGSVNVGESLYYKRTTFMGTVARIDPAPRAGYSRFILAAPLPVAIEVWSWALDYEPFKPNTNISDKVNRKYNSIGGAIIEDKTTKQVFTSVRWTPIERAQYKIKVTRVTSVSDKQYQIRDKLTIASITTRFIRQPILTKERHVFMEVRIRATNQLSGSVQNISADVSSVLDVWDGTKWVKEATDNPAWVFCDLLTGRVNKKRISKDRLHLPSIVAWAQFCDEVPASPPGMTYRFPRFTSNFVLDFDTTLQGILNNVANAAQASLNIVDGKYGVLVDRQRTIPVQIFTTRNSWGFSSSRSYVDSPHALKITYIDSQNVWDMAEAIIYDEGYDAASATLIEEMPSFGCTNYEQAWRLGRYMMAQSKLRKENITLSVDFEHLVCSRGDFVQIAQDVMRSGGQPCRVISVVGNEVTVDEGLETITGANYGYTHRSKTGLITTSTLTIVDSDTFIFNGAIPEKGDLVIIGEVGKIVLDCIVKSIAPESSLSATLTLVEKADPIYTVESTGVIPPYNPNLTRIITDDNATPGPVTDLVVTENSYRILYNGYEYFIDIDWTAPVNSAVENYEIYVDAGEGLTLVGTSKDSAYEYMVKSIDLNQLHTFKVLAVSANGKKINLLNAPSVSATPIKKITRPSDVPSLFINITNEVISLDWPAVRDADLREYLIRYSPRTTGASWEASIPLLRADRNTTLASTQGRTGTYLIKAVDYNGNESLNVAEAITSIPNLFDLNFIEETDDFPTLRGAKTNTRYEADALILKKKVVGAADSNEYYEVGYYAYENFLDLGSVYTVRLQSLIEAEGYTVGDLMANWTTLNDVTYMTNARQSEWDVKTQYRTTNTFRVIADWNSLDTIEAISEGETDDWTPWRDFTIGDATGRIFQFRLKLISNKPSVTPRVFEGKIKADMPDRITSGENVICPVGGMYISHTPAYKGPEPSPNIQLTQDDASPGDTFTLSQKSLEGFYVEFFDGNGNSVSRQFDYSAKGFGRRALRPI